MKPNLLVTSILICTPLFGCNYSQNPPKIEEWNRDRSPPPALFFSSEFSTKDRTLKVENEYVSFSQQRIGPAIVEGGSLQVVVEKNGKLLFGKARHVQSTPTKNIPSVDELQTLFQNRYTFLENLKSKNILPKDAKFLSDPELVLLEKSHGLQATYSIDVLYPLSIERFWISPKFKILKRSIVSSAFESHAWIFTPHDSEDIHEVLIKNLLEGSGLKSLALEASSQSGQNANYANAPWKFEIEDPRFDQVQAFYFITEALQVFRDSLGVNIPFPLRVETFFGFPDRTNAALTYNNQIRIGTGDGAIYKGLARDPSIVMHEVGHILVNLLAHLPTQGEGGSLNEAFCDFFAASILNNPRMGERSYIQGPYKRNLTDFVSYAQKNGGLYHDSQIVSGTLWKLRSKFGNLLTQRLAVKTLVRLGPAHRLEEFPHAIMIAAPDIGLSEDQVQMIKDTLTEFSWPT